MTLVSSRDAKRAACEWVDQQTDVPGGRVILPRNYDPEIGGRRITVMVKEPPRGKNFLLIELYICNDSSVKVTRDRRLQVQQLFEKHGSSLSDVLPPAVYDHETAVVCFMSAAKVCAETTPLWFKGVEEVEYPTEGARADAYVKIEPLYASCEVDIPIKVVMSNAAKARFNKRLSGRKQERTVAMVITPNLEAEQIQERLYHYLGEMRKKRTYR